jgi:acetyl-CoA C-acetyltransferase
MTSHGGGSGLRGEAAIIGFVELAPERKPTRPARFAIEQWAALAGAVIEDAGIDPARVNGLVATGLAESSMFVPATLSEYLGLPINYGEVVDLGGASSAGMIWRAAVAVELGLCDAVLCVVPGSTNYPRSELRPPREIGWWGASSNAFGSPQAEFEIPYGNLGQNAPYAQIARRYAAEFGYDPRATAKIAVDQRANAGATPDAVFHGQPITIDDVLASPMIADPLHMLEVVMYCHGGNAVLIANAEVAATSRNRPVWITGFGEHLSYKTPTYADDLLRTPIAAAAEQAFSMAGVERSDIDVASIYDCYTITVLMSLEDAGFCEKGTGMTWVHEHDLTYRGDFPLNTAGGQLSFGQAGMAGGMHHVCDGARQVMGRAGAAQVADCNTAFVSGNGGIMSEQVALILQGD